MKEVVFNMEPFSCPSCVKKIETALSRIDGVHEVSVRFHSGRVRASYDSGKTTVGALEAVLKRLGYPVLSANSA